MEKRSLSRIKAIDSFDGTLLRCVAMNERISQASSDKRTKSQNVADQNKSLRPLEELEELRKVIEVHENELTRLRNINDILVAERSRYFPMMKELLSSRDTLKKQKDLRNRRKNEKASDYIHSLFNGVPDNDEAQDTSDDEDDPDEEHLKSSLFLVRLTSNHKVLWKKSVHGTRMDVLGQDILQDRNDLSSGEIFRSLLSNHHGKKVQGRSVSWLRTCARAILYSATNQADHMGNLTVNFPEFVYAWFEPPANNNDVMSTSSIRHTAQQLDDANTNRWELYYGLKRNAATESELAMFSAFLNEDGGEDYLSMVLVMMRGLLNAPGCHAALANFAQCFSCLKEDSMRESNSACIEKEGKTPDSATTFYPGARQEVAVPLDVVCGLCQRKLTPLMATAMNEKLRGQHVDGSCEKHRVVDTMTVFKHVLDVYKDEANHIRDVVNLLFKAAPVGVLTRPIALKSEDTEGCEAPLSSNTLVKLPQFLAIMRSLLPGSSTDLACAIYRETLEMYSIPMEAEEKSKSGITCERFLRVADKRNLFTQIRNARQSTEMHPFGHVVDEVSSPSEPNARE